MNGADGSGVWISGQSKKFELNDTGNTIITLNRENVSSMTNSVYTVEAVNFEGSKTDISEDKKSFAVMPVNVENNTTVILALYNGDKLVEVQSNVYTGEIIDSVTNEYYTTAKVMIWDELSNAKPICNAEIIK